MRQVFLSTPWIHHEEPQALKSIYYKYGRLRKIKKNTFLRNGGENAQISLLVKGLGTFSFETHAEKQIVFALIVPNRVLGDMDGFSGKTVNVNVRIIRDSEILSLDREVFIKRILEDSVLSFQLAQSLIAKQEGNLEAMIACHTLDAAARLKVFLKAQLMSFQGEVSEGFNTLPLRLSNEEIAAIINVSRVTVSALFSKWKQHGLLQKQGRVIEVHAHLFNDVYDWLASGTPRKKQNETL